jgi:hypothetical protein
MYPQEFIAGLKRMLKKSDCGYGEKARAKAPLYGQELSQG